MSKDSDNLVLHQLRLLREDMNALRNDVRNLDRRMDSFELYMKAFFNELTRQNERLSSHDHRLDRLEEPLRSAPQ